MKQILEGGKNLAIPIMRSQIPCLRLAFNKLFEPSKDHIVRRAVVDVDNSHKQALKTYLLLWKLNTFKDKVAEGMTALRKRPHIVDGAEKLRRLEEKRPRKALRSFDRNVKHKTKQEDAVKKLMLINRGRLQAAFLRWAGKDDFAARFKKAKNMANALNLNLRPLKVCFDALKIYDPDRVKAALRRVIFHIGRRNRYFLGLWAA